MTVTRIQLATILRLGAAARGPGAALAACDGGSRAGPGVTAGVTVTVTVTQRDSQLAGRPRPAARVARAGPSNGRGQRPGSLARISKDGMC